MAYKWGGPILQAEVIPFKLNPGGDRERWERSRLRRPGICCYLRWGRLVGWKWMDTAKQDEKIITIFEDGWFVLSNSKLKSDLLKNGHHHFIIRFFIFWLIKQKSGWFTPLNMFVIKNVLCYTIFFNNNVRFQMEIILQTDGEYVISPLFQDFIFCPKKVT